MLYLKTRMVHLTEEMTKIQKKTNEERSNMKKKENEGTQYVKDARIDLQNICKALLQKKLENEDLRAEVGVCLKAPDKTSLASLFNYAQLLLI